MLCNDAVCVFQALILPSDGYGQWLKHVGVLYIWKRMQSVGNKLVYV